MEHAGSERKLMRAMDDVDVVAEGVDGRDKRRLNRGSNAYGRAPGYRHNGLVGNVAGHADVQVAAREIVGIKTVNPYAIERGAEAIGMGEANENSSKVGMDDVGQSPNGGKD